MAKTDVVKHDLTVSLRADATPLNVDEVLDPIPFPRISPRLEAHERLLVGPPVTALVSDEDRVKAPYRSVGKMAIMTSSGSTKGGSGWVVAPKAFITAGHCVKASEIGGWITKAKFIPRYNVTADKIYDVSTVYTLKGWAEGEERPYDMAACVVTENFADTEPPLKFEATLFPPSKLIAIGYPIRPVPGHEFNGKRMWQCAGDFIKEEDDLWEAVNNLSAGSSGGPWCDPAQKMLVNGLSAARGDDPDVAYSPDFFNGLDKLYQTVKDL